MLQDEPVEIVVGLYRHIRPDRMCADHQSALLPGLKHVQHVPLDLGPVSTGEDMGIIQASEEDEQ